MAKLLTEKKESIKVGEDPAIVERVQQMSGAWSVRYALSSEESIFLNFRNKPSDEEVATEVSRFIAARAAGKAQVDKANAVMLGQKKIAELLMTKAETSVTLSEIRPLLKEIRDGIT